MDALGVLVESPDSHEMHAAARAKTPPTGGQKHDADEAGFSGVKLTKIPAVLAFGGDMIGEPLPSIENEARLQALLDHRLGLWEVILHVVGLFGHRAIRLGSERPEGDRQHTRPHIVRQVLRVVFRPACSNLARKLAKRDTQDCGRRKLFRVTRPSLGGMCN